MTKNSRGCRGRPVKYEMPEMILDTPENIAHALLATAPKKREEWRHIREREAETGVDSPWLLSSIIPLLWAAVP